MMFSSSSKFQKQPKGKMWKRWQLFHATDFQSLMYPCFIFCSILGIFPYKINASSFETSRLRYILLTLLFCVFCSYDLIILHKIFTKTIDYEDETKTLEATSYFIFGGFVAIITYILSGPRMRVLQAMLKISSRLPPESYQKLSKWIHVKDILGTFFLVMQGCIYYSRGPEYLVFHVLATYIGLLMFHMDMQYVNCACVLKAYFKRINDSLMHLQNVVVNNKPYAPRLISNTPKSQFLLIELKTLKKQHLIVSDTMQMLNVIFSLQLLVTIALTFTDITFEVYRHVTQWQNELSIILNDETRDPFFLMSVAYSLLKLILIVWVCETGKNQAFEIGTTVHDVFNCTSDEQIKEELHLFSLQILHCARSTFSTKGLSVDATLLAVMAGSITTYVLILAQFMVMSHSCDRNTGSNINQAQITYLEEDT